MAADPVGCTVVDELAAECRAVGDLQLDPATGVGHPGHTVELSANDFSLLELVMRRTGEVLSRRTPRSCV